jgi:hypothetical protein
MQERPYYLLPGLEMVTENIRPTFSRALNSTQLKQEIAHRTETILNNFKALVQQ